MEFLRNLPVDHPEELAKLIEIRPGRVVSMALSRSERCQEDKETVLRAGACMAVPAGVTHAIGGEGPFKLLQITVQ